MDVNISTDRCKLEAAIVQLIRDWAIAFPHELVALDQQNREIRKNMLYRKGMTARRGFLHKAEIPMTLYNMMQRRFNKDWTRDRWFLNTFLRHFKVGCINTTSEVKP